MDPLSHAVIGRSVTVAINDDRFTSPGVGVAAVFGALVPDVDAAFIGSGWDIYLRAHEIGTHSIVGGVAIACLAAAVVRGFARRTRYLPLAIAAVLGAMSHIALDVVSGARVRIGWPLVDARVSVPLVAMGDPWIVLICAVGVIAMWLGRRKRRVARLVLTAAVALLSVKAVLLAQAARSAPVARVSISAFDARWGSFTEWSVFERTASAIRAWQIHSGGGKASMWLSRPIEPRSSAAAASHALDTVRNFERTHDFGFAVEESNATDVAVLWSDPRYCWPDPSATNGIACALWFGGEFDANGRAIMQEVKIGWWTQTRPAPR